MQQHVIDDSTNTDRSLYWKLNLLIADIGDRLIDSELEM